MRRSHVPHLQHPHASISLNHPRALGDSTVEDTIFYGNLKSPIFLNPTVHFSFFRQQKIRGVPRPKRKTNKGNHCVKSMGKASEWINRQDQH
jgi:hypothetical protein